MTFYAKEDNEMARWVDSGIPERLKGYSLNPARHGAVGIPFPDIQNWITQMPERHQRDERGVVAHQRGYGRGLLFAGPPGTGKTTIACAVLTSIRKLYKKSVFFIRWPEYLDARRATAVASYPGRTFEEQAAMHSTLARVGCCFAVVLDDIGHEHSSGSGYGEAVLDEVLRSRYDAGNPTIVTTNMTDSEWEQRYSAPMRSFIREACLPLPFLGEDLR